MTHLTQLRAHHTHLNLELIRAREALSLAQRKRGIFARISEGAHWLDVKFLEREVSRAWRDIRDARGMI